MDLIPHTFTRPSTGSACYNLPDAGLSFRSASSAISPTVIWISRMALSPFNLIPLLHIATIKDGSFFCGEFTALDTG